MSGGKRRLILGGGSIARTSDNVGPQVPVCNVVPRLISRGVDVSTVGAVRPLETIAPLSGAVLKNVRQLYSDSDESDNDVLPVGALIPMNRPGVCCAWLDDFDWVVPAYVLDLLLSEREIEVEVTDLDQDVLPDVFPVVSARGGGGCCAEALAGGRRFCTPGYA